MSFKDIINAASQDTGKTVKQDTGKPVSQNASKSKMVNITVKVEEELRDYWKVQSAIHKKSVAQVVKQALTDEFGLPD